MALTVSLCHDGGAAAALTLTPPVDGVRAKLCVCAVVDTSYSMHDAANPNGAELARLFSKLDVVKHGLRTALASLGEGDTFSLVDFSNSADVTFRPTALDTAGARAAAAAAVGALHPRSSTELWLGLSTGLEQLRHCAPGQLRVLLLLTDGDPSSSPPEGEVAAYKRAVSQLQLQDTTLLAFGFGYDVKSLLLKQLADAAGGASLFGFIPDGTMTATVFNCGFANLRVTAAADVRLSLRLPGDETQALRLVGGYDAQQASDGGLCAAPGSVQFGQPRTFLMEGPARLWERLRVEVTYRVPGEPASQRACVGPPLAPPTKDEAACAAARHRLEGADAIHRALRVARMDLDAAKGIVKAAATRLLTAEVEPPVLGDLLGEVSGALGSSAAFDRWGEHYLRFVADAHLQQRRNNFKDPGGAACGGAAFDAVLAQLDDAFRSIGVPVPSLTPPTPPTPTALGVPAGPITYTATVSADAFAAQFNNMHGGCFGLDVRALRPGGDTTRVRDLSAGDLVATDAAGGAARIVCVVDYISPVNVLTLPCGGPVITPWHPVRLPGGTSWCFPAHVAGASEARTVAAVRTFVLDGGHAMVLDGGVVACTLGHGFTDDVVRHPFYGTRRVLDDLAGFPGWTAGHVTMRFEDQAWDQQTGELLGYRPAASVAPAAAPVQPQPQRCKVG